MESKMKRFLTLLITLVLLASVLGITAFAAEDSNSAMPECYRIGDVDGDGKLTSKDAILTLKHSILASAYPVSHDQDCDFNGDGKLTAKDAIYVLKATFNGTAKDEEGNPIVLNETAHDYYDPTWAWEEVDGSWVASVTFKCGCTQGDHTHSSADTEDPVVIEVETVDATCVAQGTETYTATWGENSSQKVVELPAKGENCHDMDGTATCEEGAKCKNCDFEQPALGHSWKESEYTEATCQQAATVSYICSCGATKTVTMELTEEAKDNLHHYEYIDEVKHAEDTCVYTKVLKCRDCGATKNGESYNVHHYTATLTQDATCKDTGVKTYKCDFCERSYTETVPVNEAHKWSEGATENGVTTHTCSACGDPGHSRIRQR